jgi:hypothetical protein
MSKRAAHPVVADQSVSVSNSTQWQLLRRRCWARAVSRQVSGSLPSRRSQRLGILLKVLIISQTITFIFKCSFWGEANKQWIKNLPCCICLGGTNKNNTSNNSYRYSDYTRCIIILCVYLTFVVSMNSSVDYPFCLCVFADFYGKK